MTSEEMESAIKSLQKQQEDQKKHLFKWGTASLGIAFFIFIVSLVIPMLYGNEPTPPYGTISLLTILSFALTSGARPPENLSLWSRLTWGWAS